MAASELIRGAFYPLRGVAYLWRQRDLWKYAFIPLLINSAVILIAAVLLAGKLDDIIAFATGFLPVERPGAWWRWPLFVLAWIAKVVLGALIVAVSAVLMYFLFFIVGAIIAAPFNDALSQRTELLYAGRAPPEEPFSVKVVVREGSRSIVDELRKMAFLLGLFAVTLLLAMVPLVGAALAALFGGWFAVVFLAMEFVDFCLSRRKLGFADKREFLCRHRPTTFGFGLAMIGLLALPVANLFLMPIGAVAGTLLYLDLAERESAGS